MDIPRASDEGFDDILNDADNPLLTPDRARELFDSPEDREALRRFAAALDTATAKNVDAAQTWAELDRFKHIAYRLAALALGRPLPPPPPA